MNNSIEYNSLSLKRWLKMRTFLSILSNLVLVAVFLFMSVFIISNFVEVLENMHLVNYYYIAMFSVFGIFAVMLLMLYVIGKFDELIDQIKIWVWGNVFYPYKLKMLKLYVYYKKARKEYELVLLKRTIK